MSTARKTRILVVEDDLALAKVLRLQLEAEGFAVGHAANGAVAFAAIQEEIPDCVVLDLMMPVMDGFSFLKRIRTLDQTSQVPVVILTASNEIRHQRKVEQYQADAFLQKPYDIAQLVRLIRDLCGIQAGA